MGGGGNNDNKKSRQLKNKLFFFFLPLMGLSAFSFHIQHSKNMMSFLPPYKHLPMQRTTYFAPAPAGEVASFHLLKERFQRDIQIQAAETICLFQTGSSLTCVATCEQFKDLSQVCVRNPSARKTALSKNLYLGELQHHAAEGLSKTCLLFCSSEQKI